jgi:hypothetical protein
MLLPTHALAPELPMELIPMALHRANDVASDIRPTFNEQQRRVRPLVRDGQVILGHMPAPGDIAADSYLSQPGLLDEEALKELGVEASTPAAWLPVPSSDDLYRIYQARDSFDDKLSRLADMRALLQAKERNIQDRKIHNDRYKGPLPYWWELKDKQFTEEMARNRLFEQERK